jgi:hypothetical protein
LKYCIQEEKAKNPLSGSNIVQDTLKNSKRGGRSGRELIKTSHEN